MPEPTLRHLTIPTSPNSISYRGTGRGNPTIREIERREQGAILREQLAEVRAAGDPLLIDPQLSI
jgi:hypothetical protein